MNTQSIVPESREEKNKIVPGMLYLVATPIGNLDDISARALKVLGGVDFVAAEDTRNSGRLLSHFGISKPMVSYFEHNKRQKGESITARLLNGESCALITDAGTPAISDPGEDIVVLCAEKGIPVTSVPGACAAITALALSGLPTGKFVFEGFLTTAKQEKQKRLRTLASESRTIIFYEAPHKLRTTLSDLLDAFGDRRIALCRELTKLNEDICRTTIADAVAYYETTDPRGEYVLIVEGTDKESPQLNEYPEDPKQHVSALIDRGLERMDAIKTAAKERGLPKGAFYKLLLEAENRE